MFQEYTINKIFKSFKLYFEANAEILVATNIPQDIFNKQKEEIYSATKILHILSMILVPLTALVILILKTFTADAPNPKQINVEMVFALGVFYIASITFLLCCLIFPKILGERHDPNSLLAIYMVFRYHAVQLFMINLNTVIVAVVLSEFFVRWAIIPIWIFSLLTLLAIYPTRRKWEKWITGY